MARIRFEGVGKRYPGGVAAVQDLDLDIADREFVVLLGPSGCGKSTTLNMIAGLEDATEGEIRFDDEVVTHRPPHRRDVAMVFQSYALYPHKTVFENMAFGLRLRRVPSAEVDRRVRRAAEKLDITHLLARKPQQLSGGQRQRVALGRAIVREPAVFLMDEPLSNLDAALRLTMRAEIKQLHADMRTTFVYVTHDQAEALTLADRIVVMKDGRIQQIGSPEDIYERPDTLFVASFLGSPPINLLEGELEDRDGATWFRRGGLALPIGRSPVDRREDGPVVLGVRPEDVELGDGHGSAIGGVAKTILPVGSDTFAEIVCEGVDLFFRAAKGTPMRSGDSVAFRLRPDRLHLFGKASGRSLLRSGRT